MALMVNNHGGDTEPWREALQQALPDFPVYVYPLIPAVEDILYAVVWHHPHEDLLRYKNLKAILVLGAGTDHFDQAPELPRVPIVRLADPAVGNDMAQYVLYWLMHFQRGYDVYRQQQSRQHWQQHIYPQADQYQVTVLGAGMIASFISERIAMNGFKVNVWSRSPRAKVQSDIHFFSGESGLSMALTNTQTLVNCLPLKSQTRGMIDGALLSLLPKGAHFINVSRGGVVNDDDLLYALDTEQLAAAALDTFCVEPLADDHPYWRHPKVSITPHISGATYARTAAPVIIANIQRIEAGEAPFPIYTPPQHADKSQEISL